MQAVVLAGGLGTRLLPRTVDRPKSLIEVGERPFIDWQLRRLRHSGFRDVHLCIGHLGEQIRRHVAQGTKYDLAITYSEDGPHPLGTAGALRRALPQLDDPFLVTYGDSYLPIDYSAPWRDLDAHPEAHGTMSVYKNDGQWDASNTAIDGEQVVRYEKGTRDPQCDHIDYGAIALRRSVVEELPPGTPWGLDSVQAKLAAEGRLRAWVATHRFYEIGSEQGLVDLEAAFRSGLITG